MSTTWRVVIVLLAVGFVLEAVVIVALMRQIGSILLGVGPMRAPTPPPGPEVGTVVEVPGLEPAELPALLVFVSSQCPACAAVAPRLRWMYDTYGPQSEHGHQLDFVVVATDGFGEDAPEHVREVAGFARTDLVALMKDWEIPFVPFVVALDGERRVVRAAGVTQPDELETLATIGLSLQPMAADPAAISLQISNAGRNGADSMEALT